MKQRDAIRHRNNRSATRHARVASCRLASCLVLASVASTRACAQEARNPVPPQIVITPYTSVPASIGTPVPAQPADSAKPAEVGNAMRLVTGAALWSGSLSAEQAWSSGTLTVEDVFALLQQPVGSPDGPHNEEVRRDLAGLLVQHAPERVKNLGELSAMTRSALAHLYSQQGDARTLEVCEGLMRELDEKLKASGGKTISPWPWLWGIIHLAHFYESRGEVQKAAETWLRGEPYFRDTSPGGAAGVLIDAARLYVQMGGKENEQKAKELYDRVPKYGDDYMSSVALWDQANEWVHLGKYEEAQKNLEYLLTHSSPTNRLPSMQRLTCLSMLGYLHYLKGEWAKSRAYYDQVLNLVELPVVPAIPAYVTRGFAKSINTKAKEMLSHMQKWQSQPIVCDPSEINIVVSREKFDEPITRRFLVSTFGDVELSVSSSDARIKIRVEGSPWEVDVLPLQHQKLIVLEFAPDVLQKGTEATLTISSPAIGVYKASVPVSVTVKKSQ